MTTQKPMNEFKSVYKRMEAIFFTTNEEMNGEFQLNEIVKIMSLMILDSQI